MLEKYLKKLGLSSYTDLNKEERETYKKWEDALRGRKISNKDFMEFIDSEIDNAVSRLTEEEMSDNVMSFRKAEVKILKNIKSFINAPLIEKTFVEKSIKQFIDK